MLCICVLVNHLYGVQVLWTYTMVAVELGMTVDSDRNSSALQIMKTDR